METIEAGELVKSKMLIGTYVMGPGFTLGRGGNPGEEGKSGRRERDTVMEKGPCTAVNGAGEEEAQKRRLSSEV